MSADTGPQTEAGRRLLRRQEQRKQAGRRDFYTYPAEIAAIEAEARNEIAAFAHLDDLRREWQAEARTAALARLRTAVEGLPLDRGDETWGTVDRAAVLALIDAEAADSEGRRS